MTELRERERERERERSKNNAELAIFCSSLNFKQDADGRGNDAAKGLSLISAFDKHFLGW